MDELMEILEELRPDVDFAAETALIDDNVLDSFDIEIKPNNLIPANFNSAKAMWAMIEQLQDE